MKELWLQLGADLPKATKLQLLELAQGNFSVALLLPEDLPLTAGLKIKTASTDGNADIRLLSDPTGGSVPKNAAVHVVVKEKADEDRIARLADAGVRYVLVHCPNWKVIPLENLIARIRNKATLIADVSSADEARLALQTLELGVDGVLVTVKSTRDLELATDLSNRESTVPMVKGRVASIKPIGQGARVCIDTCELLKPGEGMLVGSQSSGLFLIEAEVHKNPHVEPRPFRVNAGPVSSYILTPDMRTKYLAELATGDEILIVNSRGGTRTGHIGRVKIERRPMTVVQTEAEGRLFSIVLQNAETVRLVSDTGSVPVSELKPGSLVLLRVEEGGRHFGTLVPDEMVIER